MNHIASCLLMCTHREGKACKEMVLKLLWSVCTPSKALHECIITITSGVCRPTYTVIKKMNAGQLSANLTCQLWEKTVWQPCKKTKEKNPPFTMQPVYTSWNAFDKVHLILPKPCFCRYEYSESLDKLNAVCFLPKHKLSARSYSLVLNLFWRTVLILITCKNEIRFSEMLYFIA